MKSTWKIHIWAGIILLLTAASIITLTFIDIENYDGNTLARWVIGAFAGTASIMYGIHVKGVEEAHKRRPGEDGSKYYNTPKMFIITGALYLLAAIGCFTAIRLLADEPQLMMSTVYLLGTGAIAVIVIGIVWGIIESKKKGTKK